MTLALQAQRGPWWPWLLVGAAWAALVPACSGRPAASPEPPELAEARTLVTLARLALPSARQLCATAADPRPCTSALDGLDDVLVIVAGQLDACQETETREACEAERLDELRERLPELRRLVALIALVKQ